MSKIAPLSGFPELLPAQRAVERDVIASLSRTFELHGFANIETRVVEPIERLAKGGEVDKESVNVRSGNAGGTTDLYRRKDASNACTSDGCWDYTPDGKLELLGKACQDVKSAPDAKVEIVVGCKTVVR